MPAVPPHGVDNASGDCPGSMTAIRLSALWLTNSVPFARAANCDGAANTVATRSTASHPPTSGTPAHLSPSRDLGGTATKYAPMANAHPSSIAPSPGAKSPSAKAAPTVKRDADGRIARSEAAKHDFMKQSGYPKGRPGYFVDHIVPLKRGGCDCPSNMQWQTVAAAKAKDKWE